MGFLDGLLKQVMGNTQAGQTGQTGQAESGSALGGLIEMAMKNPQIIAAIVSLLSSRDTKVGGNAGLGGLMSSFQRNGMGDMLSNWISTGPNPPISAAQLTNVLGNDTIQQFAQNAGVPSNNAASILAGLLPSVIDQLTPDGQMPETNSFESSLSSLISGLGR